MARPEYLESPRSSRSRTVSRVLPPAPELDLLRSEDEDQDSPPYRSSRGRGRDTGRGRDGGSRPADRLAPRDRDWERRQDDEILMHTPDSRASSSSHRPSRRYLPDPRGPHSTPPHSVSSSRASTRVPHPPMSSMTRPLAAEVTYRPRSMREPAPAGYDDQDVRPAVYRARSHARSIHDSASVPFPRGSVRAYTSASVTGSESNGEDTETTYDSLDDRRRSRRGADRHRRPSRYDRSPSRAEPRRSHRHPRRRHRDPARPEEDNDEMDSRHTVSMDDEPLPPLRPRSRPQSRAPSARHIPEPIVTESEDSQDDHRLRDRFERRGKHRRRHDSHKTESRRRRSESHVEPSPTPKRYVLPSILGGNTGSSHRARPSTKRYYDTEVVTVEKLDRPNPPSASLRRSNTVSGSQAAASQNHSVSSTRRSSSSTFLGNFFGPSLHSHHHHATDRRVKM